jgi:hypothetical protein
MVLVALWGCHGGGGDIGNSCGGNDDCDDSLQCQTGHCVPRCQHAPECGDGYSCDDHGICREAIGTPGDLCISEVDCQAGLSCQIGEGTVDNNNRLTANCLPETAHKPTDANFRPAGASCSADTDCRNGTCALGRCVDLCRESRDCAAGYSCVDIPHVVWNGELFTGCLPSEGTLSWSIPLQSPTEEILLPVPSVARSAELVMTVDDTSLKVGADRVLSPSGNRLYTVPPCFASLDPGDAPCSASETFDQYFANQLRHLPAAGQSVLLMPASPAMALENGAYRVRVSSFRSNGQRGTAIPQVTAVVQIASSVKLDLHFFFLDLEEHPCAELPGNAQLNASTAKNARFFQTDYLGPLRQVFAHAGLAVDNASVTYDDILDHHELDGVDVGGIGALFSLGSYATGVNVFFVRSLSPLGLASYGPNPGPAGLAGTPGSGIAISLDALCTGDWRSVAWLTAHQIARYMGLYHNVEIDTALHPTWRDPIGGDDDSATNLMYFSGPNGDGLTVGQGTQLTRSPVLR